MNINKSIFKIIISSFTLSFLFTFLYLIFDDFNKQMMLLSTQSDLDIKVIATSGLFLSVFILLIGFICAMIIIIIFSLLDIIFNNKDILEIIDNWKSNYGYKLKGAQGPQGMPGPQGDRGESIYDIYRRLEGNENKTEEEFINDMAMSIAEYMKEQEIIKEEKTNESCR